MQNGEKYQKVGGDNIEVAIGDQAHAVAAGKNINLIVGKRPDAQVTEADWIMLQELFDELKRQVEIQAPQEKKDSAIERVEELEEAVTEKPPDLTTMQYIAKWFSKNLPGLVGTITSVLVHPIVGKVVEAAGELAAEELKEMFGRG